MPTRAALIDLLPDYDGVLLDAFGVLVESSGAIAGAVELIAHLEATATPYLILTNDASRHPTTIAAWYRTLGMAVDPERIVTSGGLIGRYLRERGLDGAPCVVLGTEDSRRFVVEAGGAPVELTWSSDADVLAVCDEAGFDFLESLDQALTLLFRRLEADRPVHLLLPNPDLIYPRGGGRVGFTSGAMALLIEAALDLRFPGRGDTRFACLGKPHRPIFEEAAERLGSRDLLMVGDQLATDIRGACAFGIDSALVATGLGQHDHDFAGAPFAPTFLIDGVHPGGT